MKPDIQVKHIVIGAERQRERDSQEAIGISETWETRKKI